jgi:hypothetical protein
MPWATRSWQSTRNAGPRRGALLIVPGRPGPVAARVGQLRGCTELIWVERAWYEDSAGSQERLKMPVRAATTNFGNHLPAMYADMKKSVADPLANGDVQEGARICPPGFYTCYVKETHFESALLPWKGIRSYFPAGVNYPGLDRNEKELVLAIFFGQFRGEDFCDCHRTLFTRRFQHRRFPQRITAAFGPFWKSLS